MKGGNRSSATAEPCPCGSALEIVACCGPRLSGECPAQTAEALMRSRYSAYVLGDAPYLLATWHPDTRPSRIRFDEAQRWLGLRVKACSGGLAGDTVGTVEFVARYKVQGKGFRMHENSRFCLLENRWFYVDGDHL